MMSIAQRDVFLVVASLLVSVVCGCQSSVPMTRPDAGAVLERPGDWLRERDQEQSGILFQIRHSVEPARVRLRRLQTPLIEPAHHPWALLRITDTFDDVDIQTTEPTRSSNHQGLRLVSDVTDDGEPLTHELHVTNAGAETYVLEAWGSPKAMAATSSDRADIVQSLQLPPANQAASSIEPVDLSEDGWRLRLPAVDEAPISAQWHVSRPAPDRLAFALASHLIEGEVLVEALDYPIDAVEYAETALGYELGDDITDPYDVPLRQPPSNTGAAELHTTRRFITRGERAVQIVVSTPAAVYERNSDVIDALVETLELVEPSE